MRCVVVNEHTLCYPIPDFLPLPGYTWLGVLQGSVLRGGHDWKDGPIAVGPSDAVRIATKTDFAFFRVSPVGYFGADDA